MKSLVNIDESVAAAISAAIAAYGDQAGYRLVVRNIRRINQLSPVWNSVGRMETMGLK